MALAVAPWPRGPSCGPEAVMIAKKVPVAPWPRGPVAPWPLGPLALWPLGPLAPWPLGPGPWWGGCLSSRNTLRCNAARVLYLRVLAISLPGSSPAQLGPFFFKNLHATLDSQLMRYFAEKAPAGRLSGSNYMIIYDF